MTTEPLGCTQVLPVRDYDLAATLSSGQSFAWTQAADAWEGVVQRKWVRLRQIPAGIQAHTVLPEQELSWLTDYLQTDADLPTILATFPPDLPILEATRCCGGLRILRQDPWECLASFLLSATKQITQIHKVHAVLCRRLGEPVAVPLGYPPAFAFPAATSVAHASEETLRQCGMGFRARYLHEAARRVARGELELSVLRHLPLDEARARLLELPGIGPKIADCVLLFSLDQARAFPIDVWVARALRNFYFGGRPIRLQELREFAATRFGPWGGHAQQFLFHYARHHARLTDKLHARTRAT